ncbi:baseplate J/gp47 family protein [Derxia lacustris]|uniref:hypothetical protein n=1 Tax=Derxia lacustris TaxID=764842 RepID=UPI000A1713AC|nr:hypothetical protein [Derxia lacustris]
MADGTHQLDRFPAALGAGRVGIDESTFADRVATSAALARQLRYINPGMGGAEADWLPMFAADDALTLARVLAIDVDARSADFLRLADSAEPAQLLRRYAELRRPIDDWLHALRPSPPRLPEGLLALMQRVGDPAAFPPPAGPPPARDELRRAFVALASLIERMQELARDALPAALADGQHAPAPALLMAFLQLYDVARERLNGFAARHADFYYRDVLRARPRPARTDWAHLICLRTPRFDGETRIARGSVFSAGKDAAGQPIEFAADHDLLVTDARVTALRTLRLERDRLISPEHEFGYVCRARASAPNAEPLPTGATGAAAGRPWWPMFGGDAAAAIGHCASDAQIGFALASPLLFLAEGEREIRLELAFDDADPTPDAELLARLLAATDADAFRRDLGHWFARWMFDARPWFGATPPAGCPSEAERQAVAAQAALLLGARVGESGSGIGDPLALIGSAPPDRDLIFDRVMRHAFALELSCADGWRSADAGIVPLADLGHVAGRGGLVLTTELGPDAPAVVAADPALHDGLDGAGAPLLRARLRSGAGMYCLSLLGRLRITAARIEVTVRGLRNLLLANQFGALDPARPFAPFGPLPTAESWLVVGGAELARKPVVDLTLRLAWGGLPRDDGGFATHYRGYPGVPGNADFTAAFAVLHDGRWQAGRPQPLFAAEPGSGRLRSERRLSVEPGLLRDHFRPGQPEARYDLTARNAFVRLQLASPPDAFGHQTYPRSLTEAVTQSARRKQPARLPNPPYTPTVEGLAVDYRAEARIDFGHGPRADAAPALRFFHLHPFGSHEVHAVAAGGHPFLLPGSEEDGNLYLGIEASELQGPLSLLFELREEAAHAEAAARPRPVWACLANDRWLALEEARVLLDTTRAFLGTGIVMLDIPAAATRDNRIFPAGRFWLRVSVRGELPVFDAFAGLYAVRAQALRVSRLTGAAGNASDGSADEAALAPLPAGSLRKPARPVPGLGAVEQVGASFGFEPAETRAGLQTRLGERLRHKQRAVTAWDYERLVLDRFPEVLKVKCFMHRAAPDRIDRPGHVLVMVLPAARGMDDIADLGGPRLNSIALERIADELRALASPSVTLRVMNARYEPIQVRCAVRIHAGHQPGVALRRLDRAIGDFLSPWREGGRQARFDWTLASDEVEARIRALDYIDDVARLSLLHFVDDGERGLRLRDSALVAADGAAVTLRAHSPGSIAIPTDRHILTTFDAGQPRLPEPTGVAGLSVGATFIVGGQGDE